MKKAGSALKNWQTNYMDFAGEPLKTVSIIGMMCIVGYAV